MNEPIALLAETLIPPFDARTIFIDPWAWSPGVAFKICWLAAMVFVSCGLAGIYLILRRLSLIGDAMSHSVLPGIVIAFILAHGRPFWITVGAAGAGLATALLIESLHRGSSRVKQDVAIGISFTTLFAIGVVLLTTYAGDVHIDADCVLYGDIEQVAMVQDPFPPKLVQVTWVAVITVLLIGAFYKELLVSAFDPTLATSMGIRSPWVHYGLMGWLSIAVVSAFEAVGSIMVVGMLILPGATGLLLSERLPRVMVIAVGHGILSAFGGYHLALWLNCKVAAAMITFGFALFLLAWIASPGQGLVAQWIRRRRSGRASATAALNAA